MVGSLCSDFFAISPWDRGQISFKSVPKVSKFYIEKGYLC